MKNKQKQKQFNNIYTLKVLFNCFCFCLFFILNPCFLFIFSLFFHVELYHYIRQLNHNNWLFLIYFFCLFVLCFVHNILFYILVFVLCFVHIFVWHFLWFVRSFLRDIVFCALLFFLHVILHILFYILYYPVLSMLYWN